jgi:MraZ protein
MRFFSSTTVNKIDDKGRVSIPAAFRKVLDAETQPGLWLIPGLRDEPAIEGLGSTRFEALAEAIDAMNPLDPAAIALSNKVMGKARHLLLEDNTGRIVLPRDFRQIAGIEGEALFVGLGKTFQIWNPEAYAARQADLDRLASENFARLPWGGAGRGA